MGTTTNRTINMDIETVAGSARGGSASGGSAIQDTEQREADEINEIYRLRLHHNLMRSDGLNDLPFTEAEREIVGANDVIHELNAANEDAAVDTDAQNAIALSDRIVGMSQKESTKDQYASAQKRFVNWLLKEKDYLSFLKAGAASDARTSIRDVILPLPIVIWKRYLAFITYKDKDNTIHKSFSTVAADIAALTSLHAKEGLKISEDICLYLNQYKKGILRKINQLRQSGKYKTRDGKSAANLRTYIMYTRVCQ